MQSLRMRPIVTCLYKLVLVKTASPTKTDEPIEVMFGSWTRVGTMNRVYVGPGFPQWKEQVGEHLSAHWEVLEIPTVGHQNYSVSGSSDAAFRCQYCSNLLLLAPGRGAKDLHCESKKQVIK